GEGGYALVAARLAAVLVNLADKDGGCAQTLRQGLDEGGLSGSRVAVEQDVDPRLAAFERCPEQGLDRFPLVTEMREIVPGELGRGRGTDQELPELVRPRRRYLNDPADEFGSSDVAAATILEEPLQEQRRRGLQSLADVPLLPSRQRRNAGGAEFVARDLVGEACLAEFLQRLVHGEAHGEAQDLAIYRNQLEGVAQPPQPLLRRRGGGFAGRRTEVC